MANVWSSTPNYGIWKLRNIRYQMNKPTIYHTTRFATKTVLPSTKLRVVFDASAKTSTNVSLNDVFLKGPSVQEDLVSIMTRFRAHKYVLTADIKKNVAADLGGGRPAWFPTHFVAWRLTVGNIGRAYQYWSKMYYEIFAIQ